MRRENKMLVVFCAGVFLLVFGFCLSGSKIANAEVANHVIINEVSVDSFVGTGGTDDDWVELYNPTNLVININGWSIQKTSSSGGSLYKQTLSGSVPANSYFLIVRNGAMTNPDLIDRADTLASDSFALANNNIVYLVNDNSNITDSNDLNIVDFVGFGSASFYEGSAPAPSIAEAKSVSRLPDGEDTDQNFIDFAINNSPTPKNSLENNDDFSGKVVLTITPDLNVVQNITTSGAEIVFQVNDDGSAKVNYGLDNTYGQSTLSEVVLGNTEKRIILTGLTCGAVYHYSIFVVNSDVTENDASPDAIFTTLPCGITVGSLSMVKASAKANNNYSDGWEWEFNITIWNMNETSLKMKFNQWTGSASLNAGGNMKYSVDEGNSWIDISTNGIYPSLGANIANIDNSASTGRQVKIIVKMKVPAGTKAGNYNSSYGILTE